ncbi:hypothetical protein [Chelatococcus reniformis]|uniref:Uncharacterized protein n=1 Tax=Chelatococcus reniformis TaxID=1494448 RepID=A0A916UXH6_9HYPH|nr:hypothetical protein [Chelatococcus reniformis]GGC92060.1 hypothetical protein GCM10010994_57320 [Chelatococcus reniformis]
MTSEDQNAAVGFSDAVVAHMLGRAIAEGLSDVVGQPLPPALVELLHQLDNVPVCRGGMAAGARRPATGTVG